MSKAATDSLNRPTPHVRPWAGGLAGLLLLAASGGIFYKVYDAAHSESLANHEDADRQLLEKQLNQFLADDAKPLLAQTRDKDLKAITAALNATDAVFKKYGEGVPKFASDMTGWGTRFKVIWRKGVESAEGKQEHTWTQELVQEKFARHVMSDASLERDVMAVLKQFAYDLQANRNEMLATLQMRLEASHLPISVKNLAMQEIRGNFEQRLQSLLKDLPGNSVAIGVGSLTAGIVAEEAVRQIVRAVVAQVAARLAASAAASGGIAGGAATAGASGGTAMAPGVGTVIGLAGGFIVGALVDWWMTDKFEEEISKQCQEFLDTTKAQLVNSDQGLRLLMTAQVEQSSAAYEKALQASLQEPLP